jgi:hypothetical protein
MKTRFNTVRCTLIATIAAAAGLAGSPSMLQAQYASSPLIPGTGQHLSEVGDDFEDPAWVWNANLPKVLNHDDDTYAKNFPLGISANGRWYEGQVRGQPDSVRRVATPPGGLPGSTGALALRSLRTGTNRPGFRQQQDDFIADIARRVGSIPAGRGPSVVTRVWFPPIDQWEDRTGCHFAFRLGLETSPNARQRGGIRYEKFEGIFWPGMFIHLDSKEGNGATGREYDAAYIWMKATDDGRQMRGPQITQTVWWTLGLSVTPDGRVHYYAKPGIEDLTEEDHAGSAYPFGYRAHRMRSFFFNVCNGDDGRSWSTEFVVDDPQVFVAR